MAVLYLTACVNGYVQFEQVLAPKETALDEIVSTMKATYGRPTPNRWRRIGRTAEDHNCILPGCRLMGEVLNIQGSNVTQYDPDSLRDVGNNRRRAVRHCRQGAVNTFSELRLRFLTIQVGVCCYKRPIQTAGL